MLTVSVFCVCGASALHWNTAVHHPAIPAPYHGALLPGLYSGKTSLKQRLDSGYTEDLDTNLSPIFTFYKLSWLVDFIFL